MKTIQQAFITQLIDMKYGDEIVEVQLDLLRQLNELKNNTKNRLIGDTFKDVITRSIITQYDVLMEQIRKDFFNVNLDDNSYIVEQLNLTMYNDLIDTIYEGRTLLPRTKGLMVNVPKGELIIDKLITEKLSKSTSHPAVNINFESKSPFKSDVLELKIKGLYHNQ